MSGLKTEVQALTEEDKALVIKAKERRLLGFFIALGASCAILYYAFFELNSSPVLFLMAMLFLSLAVLNVYILFKEYKLLAEALVKGEKHVFKGIASTKFSKLYRGYINEGYDYYVVLKDDQEQRKQRKQKMKDLKDAFMKNEDEKALNEYEALIAAGSDNDPIRIRYDDFEKIEEGSIIEFHSIPSVYLSSKFFSAGSSLHSDIGNNNFFKLMVIVYNSNIRPA